MMLGDSPGLYTCQKKEKTLTGIKVTWLIMKSNHTCSRINSIRVNFESNLQE
jgi:hypothetical protein